jgi:hypothetical protein
MELNRGKNALADADSLFYLLFFVQLVHDFVVLLNDLLCLRHGARENI